ncbi:dynamin family protein [Nocardia anaemiae]|uniref:dynamin family protein n=1 Tax=Nocardia anaemiae TaxID=263910 RepID=UPI0007A3F8A5|nr:dynamin family protein [Nocardia anaemiae]
MDKPAAENPDGRDTAAPPLFDWLIRLAQSADREDLLGTLQAVRRRSADAAMRVAVVGLRQQGKSQLINALLNEQVCVVGDRRATSVVTVVGHADEPGAKLVVEMPHTETPVAAALPFEELQSDLAKSPRARGGQVVCAEIGISTATLPKGLTLIDTPGVGGIGQRHVPRVLNEVALADAVVIVTDASQEFTEPEFRFVRQVIGLCPAAVIALTKIDIYPEWRRIADADRRHLADAGVGCRIIPVSSTLRGHAVRLRDKELNAESGYPDLLAFLRTEGLADIATKRRVRIARDLESVAHHLTVPFEAELNALRDPNFQERMAAELKARKEMSDAQAKSARSWQQVLNDGVADLNSEIDHDLRERLRGINKHIESELADGDPDKKWPLLTEWVQEQVSTAVGDNFVWAYQSAQALAERVAASFAVDGDDIDLPALEAICEGDLIDPRLQIGELRDLKVSLADRGLTAVRSGYSGAMMIGMGATMLGAAMMNPITIGAGVVIGVKAYQQDRAGRMARRRNLAQLTLRKYVDDVSFQVHKLSRDRLRSMQRELRDHFKESAEQALASAQSSLKAAQDAAGMEVAAREKRAAEVEQNLAALARIREGAARLRTAQSQGR